MLQELPSSRGYVVVLQPLQPVANEARLRRNAGHGTRTPGICNETDLQYAALQSVARPAHRGCQHTPSWLQACSDHDVARDRGHTVMMRLIFIAYVQATADPVMPCSL